MAIKGKFIKSAVHPQDFPRGNKPEIAIAGRSNAGKSTFLNALFQSKLAKVSQVPGKTRLLNFFEAGSHYVLVDMPGYGYASRSGDEILDWQGMIEGYLFNRENLKGLILIMDIRREWDKEERMLKKFCDQIGIPFTILLSKADKVTKQEKLKFVNQMKKKAALLDVFPISQFDPDSVAAVEDYIFQNWIKG